MATEDNLIPLLSPQDQTQLDYAQEKGHHKLTGSAHKTLWDWLQLLILPVVLAAGATWFIFTQTQISFESSQMQHDTDVQIALDQQQQETLVAYQKDISDLLLTQNLGSSKAGDEVRVVARARTLSTLRILDSKRKGLLTRFLYDAQLITGAIPIISLMNADLRSADLSDSDLRGADLNGAHLEGADLIRADLSEANLSRTHLSEADLSGTHLQAADLGNADLRDADLSGADLSGANVTTEQLNTTKSLADAIMPNGSKQP